MSKPPAGKGGKGQNKKGAGKAAVGGGTGAGGAAEEEEGDEEADAVVCGHCGMSETAEARKFSVCARCKLVRYCSAACQKVAWRSHKAACQTQDEQAFVDPSEELLREHAPSDFKCPIRSVGYHRRQRSTSLLVNI